MEDGEVINLFQNIKGTATISDPLDQLGIVEVFCNNFKGKFDENLSS
jgi:hypothetical protein